MVLMKQSYISLKHSHLLGPRLSTFIRQRLKNHDQLENIDHPRVAESGLALEATIRKVRSSALKKKTPRVQRDGYIDTPINKQRPEDKKLKEEFQKILDVKGQKQTDFLVAEAITLILTNNLPVHNKTPSTSSNPSQAQEERNSIEYWKKIEKSTFASKLIDQGLIISFSNRSKVDYSTCVRERFSLKNQQKTQTDCQ